MRVVVVGGGLGGLAVARGAAMSGHQVVVLERNIEFAELGAGIQLAPNGIHALDRLGLGAVVRANAVRIGELRFMDGVTGQHVASMPLTENYVRRFRNPYVVVHRGELYGWLLDACRATPGIDLVASARVTGYRQDGSGAAAVLADGTTIEGDLLIGADGVHSAIRRQFVGDGEPRVAGITVYRTIIPMERIPPDLRWNAVTWWAGPGRHFVHYPIAGGRLLNLAPSRETGVREAFSNVPIDSQQVLAEFEPLCATARRLLALGTQWRSWTLVDRDPVHRWCDGRVVLLGDAAHPALHYAAQGACQALEDAVVLGEFLRCGTDEVPERLVEYNIRRGERTARIQRAARDSIGLWHPAGAAADRRNAALSAMSESDLHDRVEWMHGVRVGTADIAFGH